VGENQKDNIQDDCSYFFNLKVEGISIEKKSNSFYKTIEEKWKESVKK
jgi:hypothetical protein